MKYTLLLFLLVSCGASESPVKPSVVSVDAVPSKEETLFTAVGTVYWPVSNQTDSTPLVTADGSTISIAALELGGIRWCALSRDLLARWGGPFEYGDKLRVTGSGDYDGVWTVRDSMNARFGATAPTHDRGVPGVVRPHNLDAISVDGKYHIDFLVKKGQLIAWTQIQIQKSP